MFPLLSLIPKITDLINRVPANNASLVANLSRLSVDVSTIGKSRAYTFYTSQTWTPPAGVTSGWALIVAAGGGSGGISSAYSSSTKSGPGGGGEVKLLPVFFGATVSIVIGAGGAAGAAGGAGGAGGYSAVDGFSALGGQGGTGAVNTSVGVGGNGGGALGGIVGGAIDGKFSGISTGGGAGGSPAGSGLPGSCPGWSTALASATAGGASYSQGPDVNTATTGRYGCGAPSVTTIAGGSIVGLSGAPGLIVVMCVS